MKSWLISLIIVSNSLAYADDSVSLTKGTPAPYDGVLLSNEKANSLKKDLLDLDAQRQINLSLTKTVDFYKTKDDYSNNQIMVLIDQNRKLSDSLNGEIRKDKYEEILWFSLGVLATGMSIYAAKKIISP